MTSVHPLDEARGQVEEGDASADWALIAREQAMRTLLATGYFTADDLAALGIPEHYRRSVHGLVTAYFRGPEPYMEEAGRRKSERPERKGAKNTVFRISAKGRRELPAKLAGLEEPVAEAKHRLLTLVGSDTGRGPSLGASSGASVRSGEDDAQSQETASGATSPLAPGASPDQPLAGVGADGSVAGERLLADAPSASTEPCHGVDSGEKPSGSRAGVPSAQAPGGTKTRLPSASTASPEPLTLLPEPPALFDPDQRSAA